MVHQMRRIGSIDKSVKRIRHTERSEEISCGSCFCLGSKLQPVWAVKQFLLECHRSSCSSPVASFQEAAAKLSKECHPVQAKSPWYAVVCLPCLEEECWAIDQLASKLPKLVAKHRQTWLGLQTKNAAFPTSLHQDPVMLRTVSFLY